MGKNSRQRRKARASVKDKETLKREEERKLQELMEAYDIAKSRKLPFQWIPCRGINARTKMGDSRWRVVSKTLRERADYVCAYCGERHPESGGTHCHEEWAYEINMVNGETIGTVHLQALKCVCEKCHNVCHPGFAQIGKGVDIDEIIERYCDVNGVDEKTAIKECEITKRIADAYEVGIVKWELEDGILNKIENNYGVQCGADIIQF